MSLLGPLSPSNSHKLCRRSCDSCFCHKHGKTIFGNWDTSLYWCINFPLDLEISQQIVSGLSAFAQSRPSNKRHFSPGRFSDLITKTRRTTGRLACHWSARSKWSKMNLTKERRLRWFHQGHFWLGQKLWGPFLTRKVRAWALVKLKPKTSFVLACHRSRRRRCHAFD